MSTSGAAGSPAEIPPEQLKLAYKAFKKRLKLTRLDSESKLGVGPLSSGGAGGWWASPRLTNTPSRFGMNLFGRGNSRTWEMASTPWSDNDLSNWPNQLAQPI